MYFQFKENQVKFSNIGVKIQKCVANYISLVVSVYALPHLLLTKPKACELF